MYNQNCDKKYCIAYLKAAKSRSQQLRKLLKVELSSSHRTRKGKFSFQSQRRAMSNNAQTTTQLHSLHMLAK